MKFLMSFMLIAILCIACQKEETDNLISPIAESNSSNFTDSENEDIVFGDMILTPRQQKIIADYNDPEKRNSIDERGAAKDFFYRWPNCVVSYKFDTQDPVRESVRNNVLNIMQELENNTNVEFRYAASTAPRSSYLLIKACTSSQASIGYGSSAPVLELLDIQSTNVREDRQARTREIRHELGHVVGLIHEHQRSDRDDFIIMNKDNIDCFSPFWKPGTFNVTYAKIPSQNLTAFDLQSIMIYASCACADTGDGLVGSCTSDNAVLTTLTGTTWGNRENFTSNDFAAIDAIYTGCSYSGGGGGGTPRPGGDPQQ